ncbi:MAG TPA: membrane dipeptidase [Tepidisphaeraceae bacterium]|nr:membrane dipeptidase [Tepidisphaeraceae bacterium]
MFIVDAHLDLAYNAVRGRQVDRPAIEQTPDHDGIPTVGLPDLKAGGVGLICATIFCQPALADTPGYATAEEAATVARRQLSWYNAQAREGRLRLVRRKGDVPTADSRGGCLDAILLLEGADPIRTPDDLPEWFEAGLRIVGLSWKQTRYAGGTGAPAPLTAAGVALVAALDRLGIIHDASHLAEESFWQLCDISSGPIMASHSNCRVIVPTDRQLSDEMAKAIFKRNGVIGINFFDKFLLDPSQQGTRRARLSDVVRHMKHFCDLAGDHLHVAIGTDMDGGLGREQIPVEIATSADLPRLADVLSEAGFGDDAVRGIMGRNWLRFFRENLAG